MLETEMNKTNENNFDSSKENLQQIGSSISVHVEKEISGNFVIKLEAAISATLRYKVTI